MRTSARAVAFSGDLVRDDPRLRHRPVELRTRNRLGDVARLLQLVRELDQRVAAGVWRSAGVRRAARDFHRHDRGSGGAEQQPFGARDRLGARRLAREDDVVLAGEPCDRLARSGRADLLVLVEQDGDLRIVAPAGVLQDRERMEDDRDPALVVGDPRPVELVAVAAVRLRRESPGRIDRVHVGDQHQLLRPRSGQGAAHHRAVPAGAGDPLGARADVAQAPLDVVGQLRQARGVRAPRFDRDHVLEARDHRRLGRLRGGEPLRLARRSGSSAGDRERGRGGDRRDEAGGCGGHRRLR